MIDDIDAMLVNPLKMGAAKAANQSRGPVVPLETRAMQAVVRHLRMCGVLTDCPDAFMMSFETCLEAHQAQWLRSNQTGVADDAESPNPQACSTRS